MTTNDDTPPPSDHDTWVCEECGEHHPVPREPSAYSPTDHFLQMYRDRDVPAGAIADCIQRGELKRDHTGEDSRRFEATIEGQRWRVVVNLESDVVHASATTHAAVTICPVK